MKISINDLSLIPPSGNKREATLNSIELAIAAEKKGYNRIWYGEHHASPFFHCCAPEVIIPVVASYTDEIQIGSGGILLNNYKPFKIAEVFNWLTTMFPRRVNLGIGRASSGPVIDTALNNQPSGDEDSFTKIVELIRWLENGFPPDAAYSNYPISNPLTIPELWVLGSSLWSAETAAQLSLPYVFADFFNPDLTSSAIVKYYDKFKYNQGPARVKMPKVILSCRVICAESEKDIRRLLAPLLVVSKQIEKGITSNFLSPEDAIKELGRLPQIKEISSCNNLFKNMTVGTPEQVEEQLYAKTENFNIEELMLQDLIADHEARLHSYNLISEIYGISHSTIK